MEKNDNSKNFKLDVVTKTSIIIFQSYLSFVMPFLISENPPSLKIGIYFLPISLMIYYYIFNFLRERLKTIVSRLNNVLFVPSILLGLAALILLTTLNNLNLPLGYELVKNIKKDISINSLGILITTVVSMIILVISLILNLKANRELSIFDLSLKIIKFVFVYLLWIIITPLILVVIYFIISALLFGIRVG